MLLSRRVKLVVGFDRLRPKKCASFYLCDMEMHSVEEKDE
jgi:hypothetical protein